MSERRTLSFSSIDEIVADIEQLRARGSVRCGNWSLAQICWHLNMAMRSAMRPGPHAADTPQQLAMRPRLESILASGKLPFAVQAPEQAVPPAECTDAAINEFLATLRAIKTFPGPFAPHRLFGSITGDELRRFNLIHCAHHLSHLIPN
jgi:hypothetical protein